MLNHLAIRCENPPNASYDQVHPSIQSATFSGWLLAIRKNGKAKLKFEELAISLTHQEALFPQYSGPHSMLSSRWPRAVFRKGVPQ
jgi:hypothetical protein